jgi:hypothetical protein
MQLELKATGSVSIVMVLSLKRFIQEGAPTSLAQRVRRWLLAMLGWWLPQHTSAMARFDHVRGSGAYADFLKRLRPSKWFELDAQEARIEAHGHELRTFRQYLIDNYFFPTYQLMDNRLVLSHATLQDRAALLRELERWIFKIRLTRNGLAVVKLERQLDSTTFIDITRMILEIQRVLPTTPAEPDLHIPAQSQLAMNVAARFVEACGDQWTISPQQSRPSRPITVQLTHQYPQNKLPLHDRHIVYLFSRITAGDQEITAQQLQAEHADSVVGLLESSMLIEQEVFRYPRYKAGQVAQVFEADTASWEDEICLITSEASFVYCPMAERATAVLSGSARTDGQQIYADYWKSIARGIEHVVALKNEVQLLERDTTRLLETIPEITRKAADGNLSGADQREILNLAIGISGLFKSLPQQRDALVPSSVFRAGYATQKFKRLMDLLGIYEIERHIETNVQELNAFLAHFNGIQLQQDAQRTNTIFSVLTIILSVLAVPSALADLVSINWLDRQTLDSWLGNILWLFQGIDGRRFTAIARLIELLGLLLLIVLVIVWRLRTGRRF